MFSYLLCRYLSLSPYNCSDAEISNLFALLVSPSINVVDGPRVRCSNGTLVMNLNIEVETPPTTTQVVAEATSDVTQITPTATGTEAVLMSSDTMETEFSTDAIAVTSAVIAATPTPQPTATITTTDAATTTLPVTENEELLICPEETTLTQSGYLAWPATDLGTRTTATCPYGGGVARRLCQSSRVWSEEIEEKDCLPAPAVQQMLASLTSVELMAGNSEQVSEQLVGLATSNFTLQEIDTVTSLASDLVGAGSTNVNVRKQRTTTSYICNILKW